MLHGLGVSDIGPEQRLARFLSGQWMPSSFSSEPLVFDTYAYLEIWADRLVPPVPLTLCKEWTNERKSYIEIIAGSEGEKGHVRCDPNWHFN